MISVLSSLHREEFFQELLLLFPTFCPSETGQKITVIRMKNMVVVFIRRFSSERSPTITVASFVFVRLFTHRVCTTFCELFTFTKSTQYLILNASKGIYLEMQNPEGFSLPIFQRYETFFRNFFKSSKGPTSIF